MKKALAVMLIILTGICMCFLNACTLSVPGLNSPAASCGSPVPVIHPAQSQSPPVQSQSPETKPVLLNALSITHTQLDPTFAPTIFRYNAAVTYDRTEVKVQFQPADAASEIEWTLNGTAQASDTLKLAYGSNDIQVAVKSKQGQTTTYTITLHREKPADPETMSPLEKQFVETAMRLMPERNPFVLAYEEAHGVKIDSYSKTVNGVRISGVPFRYGGNGHITGYDDHWWTPSGDSQYPANGLDCAELMHWIYHNMGYEIPSDSSSEFFAGIAGVKRFTPGIEKNHWVIPTLAEAKIGDIVYNSKESTYVSGKGSHVGMFLGTARKLGIERTLAKYMPEFPMDAYLYVDIGWADEAFYLDELHNIGIKGNRIFGSGIQYFPSVKGNDGKYIYESPYRNKNTRVISWKDKVSGATFSVTSAMEQEGRPFQYKPDKDSTVQYLLNISRPIIRND